MRPIPSWFFVQKKVK